MFSLELITLLGSPTSNISPNTVKFFCRLVGEMDLTRPRSLNVQFLTQRFKLGVMGREIARDCVKELREAGVLKEYAKMRDGARGMIYMVDKRWWAEAKSGLLGEGGSEVEVEAARPEQ